jgi:hypothetical protein
VCVRVCVKLTLYKTPDVARTCATTCKESDISIGTNVKRERSQGTEEKQSKMKATRSSLMLPTRGLVRGRDGKGGGR